MAFPLSGLISSAAGLANQLGSHRKPVSFLDENGSVLVTFDTVMGETHARQAVPTAFPVESGSSIADHIIRAPLTLDLLGIVTDTPIEGRDALIGEAFATAATAVLPAPAILAGGVGLSLWQSSQDAPSRSLAAFATLDRIAYGDPRKGESEAPRIISVVSKLRSYNSMMIADLQVVRDSEGGDWLGFAIKLVQIVVAQSQTISLSAMDNAALSASERDLGEQGSDAVNQAKRGRLSGLSIVGEG